MGKENNGRGNLGALAISPMVELGAKDIHDVIECAMKALKGDTGIISHLEDTKQLDHAINLPEGLTKENLINGAKEMSQSILKLNEFHPEILSFSAFDMLCKDDNYRLIFIAVFKESHVVCVFAPPETSLLYKMKEKAREALDTKNSPMGMPISVN